MIDLISLTLVNYSHPDCVPLLNIMRLPQDEAFALAKRMADEHPGETAFGRFADFDNYYYNRSRQDEYLYSRFAEKGGEPEEKHPLSFAVEGSDYLSEWFGNGVETRLPLSIIDPKHLSFTIGDSGAMTERDQMFDILTFDELRAMLGAFDGSFAEFLTSVGRKYIEAQLWSDGYISSLIS